jgi:hypothetical protein
VCAGVITSPPPPLDKVGLRPPPPPLSESLSEVNSADLGSNWCGGGEEGLSGVLEQGVKG